MKFVTTTTVDVRTNIPAWEAPTKNGGKMPDGFTLLYVPEWVGELTGDYIPPTLFGVVEQEEGEELNPRFFLEIPEEQFWKEYKEELKGRARRTRKRVEQQGIMVGGAFITTEIEDQNRISNVLSNMDNAGVEEISFDLGGESILLTKEDLKGIAAAVALHVQECFSWCGEMYDGINSLEDGVEHLELYKQVEDEINAFPSIMYEKSFPYEEGFPVEGEGDDNP